MAKIDVKRNERTKVEAPQRRFLDEGIGSKKAPFGKKKAENTTTGIFER